ncbi:hypothetical protein M5689_011425 [Euphorbia peplus]|nr:hypothetical protein M5689_011425 [Euphorbia peplus]
MVLAMENMEEHTETRLEPRMEAQEKKIDGLTREIHHFTWTFSEMQQKIAELELKLSVSEMKWLKFNGDNPHRWLDKVEMYFCGNGIPHAKKLVAARMCVEGTDVENWFDILVGMYPQITWPEFKEEVVARWFKGRECLSGLKGLEQVHQRGTVNEYLKEFEMCAAMVPGLTEDQYASCTKGGSIMDSKSS